MGVAASCRGSIRPALKYPGGKYPIANWIVGQMPEHVVYVEPFVGGGSVFLSNDKSKIDLLYDIDPDVVQVWQVLRAFPRELSWALRLVSYGRECWESAGRHLGSADAVLDAAARIVRSRWSRGGDGVSFGKSSRKRGGRDEYENSWETFKEYDLPAIIRRCLNVVPDCKTFRESLGRTHSPQTLVFCDPPYLHSTRTTLGVYRFEMEDQDHRDLLDILLASPAKVMLSGYRNPIYDDALGEWNRADKDVANHASQRKSKSRRVESLWKNF